jgi:hypothetical protein
MAKRYSRQTQSLIDGASYALRQKWAREAAAMPNADLATKMFGALNAPLIPNHKRGCVSQLGGVAKPAGSGER